MADSAQGDGPADLDLDLDPAQLEALEMRIAPDGTVTFVDFPPELLDIAEALNPDDPLVCERRALLEEARCDDER